MHSSLNILLHSMTKLHKRAVCQKSPLTVKLESTTSNSYELEDDAFGISLEITEGIQKTEIFGT